MYCTVLYRNRQNESSYRNEMNEALRMQCCYPENKALMFANIQTEMFIFRKQISVFIVLSYPEIHRKANFLPPRGAHEYRFIIMATIYDCFM